MDSSQPSLRTLILTAAKHLSLEWQNDRIRLRLPSDPPVDRCHSGPFARALRRYIPEIQVEEWDAACSDTGRQPMVYSMEKGLMSKYVHWARCLGLAEENLALPPWLTPLTAPDALSRGPAQPGVEPSFFSEPQARNLAEYQKRAIRFGVSISGKLLLADDLGLGKSIQALGVAWQYRETFPLLILCPPVQRNLWQQEIAKWTPIPVTEVQEVLTETTVLETTARVVIVSYDFLEKFEELQSSAEIDFKVVIADECHSIKHFDAHKSKVILRIASLAQRLILISSDKLVKKSAAELHPLFQSLDPYLGTQETFLRRYFDGKLGKLGRRIDPRREQELEAYLFKVIGIRRKTAEVSSELLPLRRQRIFLPKSGCSLSMGELKRMETEMFHRQRFVSDSSVSKQARLSEMKRVSHLVMQTKMRSCAEYVTETTNNGGKMLVFAYHREMLDSLEAALKETLGASGYVRIDQKTPTHERENLVTCFEEDDECHTALLSFTALSEGQSLPQVEAILFAELAWAPSIILQCEARAHGIHGIQGRTGSSSSHISHSLLIQYLLLEDCQWDSHCYERLEEKLRHVTLGTGDAAEEQHAASISRSIEPLPPPSSQKQEIHDSFPLREATQEGLQHFDERRSDEVYQVVEHLHLGLNLKLQQCYTKDSLEKKCKGNEQKLRRLHYFMKEAKKLHPVSAAFKPGGGVGARAQMVHPPKRQKLSE